MRQLLFQMVKKGASDMHISATAPPMYRIDGNVVPVEGFPPLTPEMSKALCYSVLSDVQKKTFEAEHECDLAFSVTGLSRFRANVFSQRDKVSGAFRTIPFKILTADDLGLPKSVSDLASRPNGLVLVTGPTGSGKSTTLAAMIDKINAEEPVHIVTIEDPIEFLHGNKKALINQREIGRDTESFKGALKYALRQDPDVVLVGEMRDLETIEAALTISETGHLVFGTLHTNSCVSTINRIIDVFPPHQQGQIRTKLSMVLQGVLSQQLIAKSSGKGRAMALELMIPNAAIRNLIREEKVHQIYSQMQVGQERFGMTTMNQSLMSLLMGKTISLEAAVGCAVELEELKSMVEQKMPGALHAIGIQGPMRKT